jgi:hypothetical protein
MAFLALPTERCLKLSYEEDVLTLPNACKKIAHFLGLGISETDIADICEIFSQQAIKKHTETEVQRFMVALDALEENQNDKLQIVMSSEGESKSISIPRGMCIKSETKITGDLPDYGPFELSYNKDGTCRLKINTLLKNSVTDGFQQGHISSQTSHSWETYFSSEQKELIDREILSVLKTLSSTFGSTSRNAPCPCNSRRKYKHCHGKIG